MKFHQLKALIQIADSGSIRAAARDMHLSQSALTKALRELEEEVGAELLLRSYKGVSFTPAGQTLQSRARLAMASLAKARDEINLIRGGAGARVAIAVTPLLSIEVLPRVWAEFEQLQPEAELSLSEGFLTTLIPNLLEGRVDFAIVIADPDGLPHELVFVPLTKVSALPAGRIGHPLAGARDWASLQSATWVMNLTSSSHSKTFLDWLRSSGHPAPRRIVQCASPMLMAELMRRTDIIGYCPKTLLDDPMFNVGLQSFQISPLPPSMDVGMVSLRGVPLHSAAKSLASLFIKHIGNLKKTTALARNPSTP